MSILSKKLYVQKTGGTAVACNIYSTSAEAGEKALKVNVDGVNGYVALKSTDNTAATDMRVKIGDVVYAVATKHESGGVAIPYTESYWTEAGSHSFTVPAGITRIRVAVCGGGAGKGSLFSNGKGGGNTSAFGITATGGHGGGVAWGKGAGGEPNGHASTGNNVTDGFALSFDKSSGDYGKGGNFGGSGGYDSQYVAVTSGQSYAITVGAAGGSGGTGGFVLLAYGGDI